MKHKDANKLEQMLEAIDTFTKATHTFNIQWNGTEWYAWFRVGSKMLAETLKEIAAEVGKPKRANKPKQQQNK